jgi:hypothetical protein
MYTGAYTRAEQALLDAEIMGTGLVHLVPRNDNVMYELIKPYELIFDHEEAGFGDPMDMHIVKLVNRYELIQRFPDRADDILTAAQYTSVYGLNKVYNNNMILYVESYSRYAKRHVICLNNVTLLDEDWNYEDKYGNVTFPISKIVYKEADRDWLGIGISEELKPIQMELNELIQTARYSCRLMSTPKVFCNRAANIVESQFNDEIGSLIYYDGLTPPTMGQLGQVPVDMYQQVELFYGKAYERVGISQLTASSQLPAGMQQASGKALQTYYQIESDRFQSTGKQYEKFIMDLSDKTIAYMKLMQKNGDISPRQYYDKDDSKNINWGDIDLARDQFDIQTYPVSILPSTPEGKLGVVDYLTQTGMIDTVAAKKLLQLPDTDGYLELENAPIDFVMNHVSMMLKGEEVEPDINQDFDLTLSLVTKAYFYYSLKNVKPVTLTLLENYINAIERIQVKKAAEQQVIMQQAIEAQQSQMQGGIPSGNSEPQSSDGTISGEPNGFPATGLGVVE